MSVSTNIIQQTCTRLGVPLPKPIATAIMAAAKFVAAVPTERGNVTGAALDAVAAGRDPFADPLVLRAMVAVTLADANLPNQARRRADAQIEDAICPDLRR